MIKRFQLRLGVIVPASNTNLEPDVISLLLAGSWAYFQRIGDYPVDSVPDLAQLRELAIADLETRLAELVAADVDAVAYGCTSASYAMGNEFDRELVANMRQWSSRPVVTAASAIVQALRALRVDRIALASPYEENVQEAGIAFLEAEGFSIVSSALPERALTNLEQGQLGPSEVADLARRANDESAQALVLSCTDMRAVEIVDSLEREFGKPVVTSNQALVWAALGLAGGAGTRMRGCGMLSSLAPPAPAGL